MSLLLQLHLQYTQNYSLGQQNLTFLEAKQVEHKGKFETDQRNRETHYPTFMIGSCGDPSN